MVNGVFAALLGLLTRSAALTPVVGGAEWLRGNDLSYGTYLCHMAVINALVHLGYVTHPWYIALALAVSSPLALLSWLFVERPFLRLRWREACRSAGRLETAKPFAQRHDAG